MHHVQEKIRVRNSARDLMVARVNKRILPVTIPATAGLLHTRGRTASISVKPAEAKR